MTTFFTIDYVTAIAIKKPITFEHGRAFYNNPIAIAEGDPTAPVKVAIVKSPDGILPAQTAVATDETDTFKRLAPDGAGGVHWVLPLIGSTIDFEGTIGSINATELNAGLWLVTFHAHTTSAGGTTVLTIGEAALLNGTILRQVTTTYRSASTGSISNSAFSVSGSGGSKTIAHTAGGATGSYMMAIRVA